MQGGNGLNLGGRMPVSNRQFTPFPSTGVANHGPLMRTFGQNPASRGAAPMTSGGGQFGPPGSFGGGRTGFMPMMDGNPLGRPMDQGNPAMRQQNQFTPRMMDTGGMLPDNFGPFSGQQGGSTGGGGVGYGGPAMEPNLQSGMQNPAVRTGGLMQVQAQTNPAARQPAMSGPLAGPNNGTWLDDYRQAGTQDGVPLGFTGTMNGRNYINGNPYAAEYMSQGTDPNSPSYAFGNILRQYGLLGQ